MKEFQDRYSTMFRRTSRDADDCPPAEALARLAAGRAWPWQRRRLLGHLAHCSDCADDYRVLTTARDGLVNALETQAGDSGGFAPAWLRPGLAAAGLAAFTALGVTVLVQTGGPGPFSAANTIAANIAVDDVEPRQARESGRAPDGDRVFKSDFGGSEPDDGQLFRDDFGG